MEGSGEGSMDGRIRLDLAGTSQRDAEAFLPPRGSSSGHDKQTASQRERLIAATVEVVADGGVARLA